MDKLKVLIDDALYLVNARADVDSDREAILAAMITDKLGTANKRVQECDDIMIEVNYQEVDLKALSKVRSYIDLLDSMISYNNDMYNRVMEFSLGEF